MKVAIDEDKCIGCGVCQSLCEECFQIKGATAEFIGGECKECDLKEVAESCPVDAIKVKKENNN
jgi:ferredoxin